MLNFIYTWIGLGNASGSQYLFWSGFFGDLAIFGAIIGLYWRNTCHINHCYRPGKHPFKHYKLCKKHHPDVPKKVTIAHILELHKADKKKAV